MKHIVCLLLTLFTIPAFGWDLSQHIKYNATSIDSSATTVPDDIQFANYRFNLDAASSPLTFTLNYELIVATNYSGFDAPQIDQSRLFDLTSVIDENNDTVSYHRLDRLFIAYKTASTTTRFGRQAISWGNGFVYNPVDIFNPFSPTALDKEYKPGDDMLYHQQLLKSGNDWELIYLPRRNSTSDLRHDQQSTALRYHHLFQTAEMHLLLAEHYDDQMLALGFNVTLGSTVWRTDITHSRDPADNSYTSLVTNIDYSWVFADKNFYGFLEYYHNGFAEADGTINAALQNRVLRNEVFTLYPDYIAAGLRIELHPLVNFSPTLLQELENRESSLVLNLNYDWKQNLSLAASLIYQLTELEPPQSLIQPPANTFTLLLSYYF